MRILFITQSRIGDAVLTTGLLNHLAEIYPRARFTVACGVVPAPLFEPMPFVERVIPMIKRRRAGHWRDLWRTVAGTWWSMVVDLRGSALAWTVPTLRRRVLRSSWDAKHRLVHMSSVIGRDTPFPPRLWNTPEQEAEAARRVPSGPPVLALGPTANWSPKQWPAERFARLAACLTAANGRFPGARVAVLAAASERAAAQPVLDSLPAGQAIDLVGTVDLPTTHACLKRCALYIGNDSGLMHIAAASGVPTLGLFGPSSEVFYGPWGPRCASVRGPRGFEDICWAPDFDHRKSDCLMLDLTVDMVLDAVQGLISA